MKDKILLCIPGTWADRSDFIQKLSNATDGRFIAAGDHILDRQHGKSCEFDISPAVEELEEGFRSGSIAAPISEPLLDEIGRHTSFLSLYSGKDGLSEALALSEFALRALDCGGLAVRVEGSNRAVGPGQWREGVEQAREIEAFLYHLFVWAFVHDGDSYCTIGMTFLGHPDISIETNDIETANVVYNEFARYLLFSEPTILDQQTIGFEDADGVWRITQIPHIYADDPDIDFSRGMWRLSRENS